MISVRPSEARGHAQHGWLDSHHTFSFADYYDPDFMGFRALRVINEDWIAPRQGFGAHGHRDMEIITYPLSGAVKHRDSSGGAGNLRAGEVQRMTAGKGVVHSEMNDEDEPLHLLQIWLLPTERGLEPGYEQKLFPEAQRQGNWRPIATPDARDGSLRIHSDALLFSTLLGAGQAVEYVLEPGRHAWVQLARGAGTLNGIPMKAGDGASVTDEARLVLAAGEPLEALLFDLG